MRIFLTGYMGSGKTTVGRPLARKLGFRFVDMDHAICERHNCSVAEIFAHQGEAAFREIERNLIDELSEEDNIVIATGGGAPCFHGNMEKMNAAGVTIYLKVSPEGLVKRLAKGREKRPLLRDKTDEELLEFIQGALSEREKHYGKAKIVVDCDGYTDWNVTEKCRAAILADPAFTTPYNQ